MTTPAQIALWPEAAPVAAPRREAARRVEKPETVEAAHVERLMKAFQIRAREIARPPYWPRADAEQDMWFHLLRIAQERPRLYRRLMEQRPFYVARKCGWLARAQMFQERAERFGVNDGRKVVGREATREIVEYDASPATLSPLEADEEALWTRPLFAHLASLYA